MKTTKIIKYIKKLKQILALFSKKFSVVKLTENLGEGDVLEDGE